MYLPELLLMLACGTLFASLGWRIWKKEQINLIHSYHYKKVKDRDKKAYTEMMGKAMLVMSVGMYLTGIIDFLFHTTNGWTAFCIFFAGGLIMMYIAQRKYNHGVF